MAPRQPSKCLLTQKGCRHGAHLPHGGGAGMELREGGRGPKGVSGLGQGTHGERGRDHGDQGIAQVTCPRRSRQ